MKNLTRVKFLKVKFIFWRIFGFDPILHQEFIYFCSKNTPSYARFPLTPFSKPKDATKLASSNDANKNKSNPTKAWISSSDNPDPSSSTTNDIYKFIHAFRYKDLALFDNYVVQVLK